MTWSAPTDRTRSTLRVLHTPVTLAPKALAICTANVPTPPDAPVIRTVCPGCTLAISRSACRAVKADTGPLGRGCTRPGFRCCSCRTPHHLAPVPAHSCPQPRPGWRCEPVEDVTRRVRMRVRYEHTSADKRIKCDSIVERVTVVIRGVM